MLGTLEDRQSPFFIEWLSTEHASNENEAVAKSSKLEIAGDPDRIREWIGEDFTSAVEDIGIDCIDPNESNDKTGLVAVHFTTPNGNFRLD